MELAVLTNENKKLFWNFVTKDYCDYYFFIQDWVLEKERTEVFITLKEEHIVGLLLIYDNKIVQLRGEPTAINF